MMKYHRLMSGLFMTAGVLTIRFAPQLPLIGDLFASFTGFVAICLGVVVVKTMEDDA